MKTYIGTKIVQAEPDYSDPNEECEVRLPGYKVVYPDGYESWSPKNVFEKAYRPVDEGLNFGSALYFLKRGKKVARKGWNGKGIFIELARKTDLEDVAEAVHNAWWEEKKAQGVFDHPDEIPYAELSESTKDYDRVTARSVMQSCATMTQPYIYIDTTGLVTDNPAAPKGRVPWLASQTDMLAEDWEVVE